MRKIIFVIIFLVFTGTSQAQITKPPIASQVKTSTTNFDKNLSSADNTVQKALDTLDDLNIGATTPAPTSPGAEGTAGTIKYDSGYLYLCTATNTWLRVQLSTWTPGFIQKEDGDYLLQETGDKINL